MTDRLPLIEIHERAAQHGSGCLMGIRKVVATVIIAVAATACAPRNSDTSTAAAPVVTAAPTIDDIWVNFEEICSLTHDAVAAGADRHQLAAVAVEVFKNTYEPEMLAQILVRLETC